MAAEAAPFGQLRLRASLDVDVMALHEEIARQSRALDRLLRHTRDLAFEFSSLHVPKTIEALRSLSDRSREMGSACPEELGKAAEITGRLASLMLEQSAIRDGHVADAVGRLGQALADAQSYRTWGKDFEIALSSYEIAKGRAKQAKARGEELTESDAAKRATKRQCQAAGLAVVARLLAARGRLQSAAAAAAALLAEAYEEYIRATLDSLAPIAASRVALAAAAAAAPAPEAQLEALFPGVFEAAASAALAPPASPLAQSSSPAALSPMPPPTFLPPPPPSQPPPPPTEAPASPGHHAAEGALSPRWGAHSVPAGQLGQVAHVDMRSSAGWGGAKPSAAAADGDLRTSLTWGGARSGSSRPAGTARIQLGATKSEAVEGRSPSPVPSPRGQSPQRSYSKALPPVPPASRAGGSSGPGTPVGSTRPAPANTERERSHGVAPAAVMALLGAGAAERKGSASPGDGGGARHVFEVQKVAKAKLQGLMPGTLEVDLDARTIVTYHVKKQTRKVYPADSLMKIQRSKVNPKKMKIYWTKKETPQRYHLHSQEERERFIEAACWARHLVASPPSTPLMPKLAAPLSEEVSIWIGSWNMGNAGPPADLGLLEARMPRNKHDIYVVAVQECDFEHAPGYGSCEEEWFLKVEAHLGDSYVRLAGLSLLAIRLLIVVKKEHLGKITQVQKAKEATGIGGVYGNKGGVGVSFYFNETALAFVGAHLAARDERVKQRNDNYRDIVSGLRIAREPFSFPTFCDFSFFCGDLNYRVTAPRDKVLDAVKTGRYEELLVEEQLNAERSAGNCFAEFKEGSIRFQPTYRYNRGDRTFSDEKMRTPSWCDRVLYRALPGLDLVQTSYTACSAMTTSDHNAISATFRLPTLLANVPHVHAPSRLLVSGLRLELTGEALTPKPPTDPHIVWHCSLAEEPKSLRPLKRQAGAAAAWGDDEPHVLVPFIHNKEWIHTRHIQLCVKDHRGEYGQAVLSLAGVCDGRPVPFSARLLMRGKESGSIRGEIQFALDATDRRKPSSTPLGAAAPQVVDEKCGYLLKQGATRKNWKRRWFECRNGTMTYTLNRDARQQFGSFSVRGATVGEALGTAVGKQHCISVVTPKRVWLLCCDSFDDMRLWLDHLKRQALLPP